MKHIIVACMLVPAFVSKVYSQTPITPTPAANVDTSWKRGGFIGINFTQVSLSHWAPGGENSIALSGTVNLFANYAKGNVTWDNTADLAYATLKSGAEPMRKNDDKIDITSKYGRSISEKWQISGLVNFKSQFAPGYNYPDDSVIVSEFFSPASLTIAPGITWKPFKDFEVFLSPASAKFTFVNNEQLSDIGAYGVKPGEKVRSEFGAYLNMKLKKDIMENVTLASKLELFNNYTDEDKDNAKNIDVNWETNLNMKVNKFITASVTVQVVYDANIIERTQFRETIGVGFGYKF